MDPKYEQIRILVSGSVQGVGFRYAAQRTGQGLTLNGWVRNAKDGNVEILVEGPTDRLEQFLFWCKQGPPSAQVSSLEITSRTSIDEFVPASFEVRYT